MRSALEKPPMPIHDDENPGGASLTLGTVHEPRTSVICSPGLAPTAYPDQLKLYSGSLADRMTTAGAAAALGATAPAAAMTSTAAIAPRSFRIALRGYSDGLRLHTQVAAHREGRADRAHRCADQHEHYARIARLGGGGVDLAQALRERRIAH